MTITYDTDPETVVRTREQETVVRSGGSVSGVQPPPPAVAAASKGIPFYMWLFPLIGLIIGIGLIGGYIVISKLLASGNTVAVSNTSNANGLPSVSPTILGGTPMSSATPFATPNATATVPPPPTPNSTPPPQLASYPKTSRMKFASGGTSASLSGEVNPGDSRSAVLACRAGQSLRASVSSAGGCVTIRGGGSSYSTYTSSGDNYVTVSNSCSTVARFSLTVSVY